MKKHIPNILTSFRTIVAILVPILFYFKLYNALIISLFIALSSDMIDGYLARKWKVVSTFGKMLDAIGDKLLAISTLLSFIIFIDSNFTCLLIGEIVIAIIMIYFFISSGALKERNYYKQESSIYGKIKTVFLFITLALGLLSYKIEINNTITILIITSFILQLLTAYTYINIYRKKGKNEKREIKN